MHRLAFSKSDTAKFISHLDLMRTFQRAFFRAGLDIRHTEGFNPRPHLVFAPSLSVGCGGEREVMDFRLDGEASNEEIKVALAPLMPQGIEIIEVFTAEHKLKEIEWGEYELAYDTSRPGIADEITSLFSGSVTVMKFSKKGDKEIDITPMLSDIAATEENGALTVRFLATAADGRYLGPLYVVRAIAERLDFTAACRVTRKRLLLADKTEFR